MDLNLIAVTASALVVILLVGVYMLNRYGLPGGGGGGRGKGRSLPLPPMKRSGPPWNVSWVNNEQNVTTTSQGMKISFKPGKFGSESGAQFRANPNEAFPADTAYLSYDIYIPGDFPWTQTGKLGPGFCVGVKPGGCSSGGETSNDSGSLRVTWDGKRKGAKAYIYLPLQVGGGNDAKAIAAQGPAFRSAMYETTAGVHLWHKDPLPLHAGRWNSVSIYLALNTPGRNNGSVSLTVNGRSRTMNNMVWRTRSDMRITEVLFAAFFGGSDVSYAPNKETSLTYRNFTCKTT